ncbi:ATP--guanido phosphotransferase [Thermanaerovibrio acidaminovorans]|uniref:ATP--guanido phosphotransferase n=1 Tax=Thermanaerovibrio acidaminovorans TaxID=81462 RepID=UPI00249255E4|nr:ATP--guanido phosphotransferase [Thermanaerovibrio acidaminovorans]
MLAAELASRPLEWFSARGDLAEVVMSSRIRFARNLKDRPFPTFASPEDLTSAQEEVMSLLLSVEHLRDSAVYHIDQLDSLSRQVLLENRQISPALARGGPGRSVVTDSRGVVSAMVNEEDHLRLQVLLGGLNLREALSVASSILERVDESRFAFHRSLGFLSSCPTNVGTGLRASVMLHLPGLQRLGRMEAVSLECQKLGLVVRGAFGEGTPSQGAIFQISNQVTLGPTEEELEEKTSAVARRLFEEEMRARQELLRVGGENLEDSIFRAYGILTNARLLSGREAMELLSTLRLGSSLGMLRPMPAGFWNRLVMDVQPGRVQALRCPDDTDPSGRRRARAALVRERLAELG